MKRRFYSLLLILLLSAPRAFSQTLMPALNTISASGTSCTSWNNTAGSCDVDQLPAGTVSSASITLAGTWSGTIQFETSADYQNTWQSVLCVPVSGGAGVSSATTNNTWSCPMGGMTFLRARASAWTSGIANVTIQASIAGGSVSPNSGAAGALATYAGAGGSTVVGPDAGLTSNGSGTLTLGAPGVGGGVLTLVGSTSGTGSLACNPSTTCAQFNSSKSWAFTAATAFTHLNQGASGNYAGSCTQSSGSCTWTLSGAFTSTPLCAPFKVSGTVTGVLSVTISSTTVTINDAVTTDTGVTGAICVGNPN